MREGLGLGMGLLLSGFAGITLLLADAHGQTGRLTRSGSGEFESVISEPEGVRIGGKIYRLAPELRILGAEGQSLAIEDLALYQAEWIYFRYRGAVGNPLLVEIQIQPDDGD